MRHDWADESDPLRGWLWLHLRSTYTHTEHCHEGPALAPSQTLPMARLRHPKLDAANVATLKALPHSWPHARCLRTVAVQRAPARPPTAAQERSGTAHASEALSAQDHRWCRGRSVLGTRRLPSSQRTAQAGRLHAAHFGSTSAQRPSLPLGSDGHSEPPDTAQAFRPSRLSPPNSAKPKVLPLAVGLAETRAKTPRDRV